MQTHTSGMASPGEFPVKLNPGGGDPFVTITIANTTHFCETLDDFDRLIRAAAEGKRLWLEAVTPAPCHRTNAHTPHGKCPGTAPEFPSERIEIVAHEDEPCGAWIATDGHRTWYCQYPPGHDGGHGPRPGEEPEPLPDEPVEFWPTGRALAGNPDGAA